MIDFILKFLFILLFTSIVVYIVLKYNERENSQKNKIKNHSQLRTYKSGKEEGKVHRTSSADASSSKDKIKKGDK